MNITSNIKGTYVYGFMNIIAKTKQISQHRMNLIAFLIEGIVYKKRKKWVIILTSPSAVRGQNTLVSSYRRNSAFVFVIHYIYITFSVQTDKELNFKIFIPQKLLVFTIFYYEILNCSVVTYFIKMLKFAFLFMVFIELTDLTGCLMII